MRRINALIGAIVLVAVLIMVFAFLIVTHFKRRGPTPEQFAAARESTLKRYAAFDKSYIPALVFTNQGKVEQSQRAMERLKEAWDIFANRHYPSVPRDHGFRRSLDKIQNTIRTADEIVNSGENLNDAHESLEEIRFIFMSLRKDRLFHLSRPQEIETSAGKTVIPHVYYIDNLNEFHESMEAIVLTAKGKTPETLADADIEKIEEALEEASGLMAIIKKAEFNQSIFDFSDEKTKTMRGYIKQEADSLDKLMQALEGGDKGKIIQASMGIKPWFVKLFTTFGDFEGLE